MPRDVAPRGNRLGSKRKELPTTPLTEIARPGRAISLFGVRTQIQSRSNSYRFPFLFDRHGVHALGSALARPPGNFGNAVNGSFDVRFCIEGSYREAHSAVVIDEAELLVNKRSAMQASASCNVVIHVQHDAHIAGIDAAYIHQDGREVILETVATVQLNAFDRT